MSKKPKLSLSKRNSWNLSKTTTFCKRPRHVLELTVPSDFLLFLIFCKRPLDVLFDFYVRCVHHATVNNMELHGSSCGSNFLVSDQLPSVTTKSSHFWVRSWFDSIRKFTYLNSVKQKLKTRDFL